MTQGDPLVTRWQWFWLAFDHGIRVIFDLSRGQYVRRWTHIYGVQVGGTFIGVVRSVDGGLDTVLQSHKETT